MSKNSQILKGILEGCILKIISMKETYGYELVESLNDGGFKDMTEGSVYPLLLRLEKKGFINSVEFNKGETVVFDSIYVFITALLLLFVGFIIKRSISKHLIQQ